MNLCVYGSLISVMCVLGLLCCSVCSVGIVYSMLLSCNVWNIVICFGLCGLLELMLELSFIICFEKFCFLGWRGKVCC